MTHSIHPATLVGAAREGDPSAWDALVRRYTPALRGIAARHRLQPADVDDVVQSCWLALLESLHLLRDPEAVGAWLVTAARRQSVKTRTRTLREVLLDPAANEERADDDRTPDAAVAAVREEAVRAAVATLPVRQRRLLETLMIYPEPSYDEVAEWLGMPRGSIGPTRARGLERLRRDPQLMEAIAA